MPRERVTIRFHRILMGRVLIRQRPKHAQSKIIDFPLFFCFCMYIEHDCVNQFLTTFHFNLGLSLPLAFPLTMIYHSFLQLHLPIPAVHDNIILVNFSLIGTTLAISLMLLFLIIYLLMLTKHPS